MKVSPIAITGVLLLTPAAGFSMLSPRFFDFPRRFGSYLKEIDEIFEQDWPTTFFEKQIPEGKDSSKAMTAFHRSSPRYEVIDRPDKFEVTLEIPGYKDNEIEVGLRAGGRILSISGTHEEKDDARMFSTKFQQNFSLDPSILINEMTADMKGNTLTITAPRIDSLPESRNIPVKMIKGEDDKMKEEMKMETKEHTKKEEEKEALSP